ncbi:restriction endonuclease [Frankia sp. R82]|uniref:restriction endonuclease n=1 Tax=Frankia sp. R82 TaxID=2950553 RepID=UPI002043A78A|nr:restriction endonuclease [Frankia sp. R82]MCM3885049.1 restriction endonuclease [Frankia sp. R82]
MTFDAAVIHRLLADARSAPTSDAKGKLYEELTRYLFETVPGCIAESNTTNIFRTEQIDVAVGNGKLADGLWLLPDVIIVECKDWEDPVDSKTVGYFMNILAGRGAGLGILVAANGITGSPEEMTNAHALGLHGAPRGLKVIVVTTEEIATLRTVVELVDLLHRRYLKAFATGAVGVP